MIGEGNWILTLPASIFGTICLTVSLLLCVCGCRTTDPKDELVGVEGRVKITNPEEYQQEVNANNISTDTSTDKTQNTAKRSLPDLPVDLHVNGRNWESSGDATSELYATVVLQDEKNKKHIRQNSESDSVSPSLTYTKVKKHHPYDKLKKIEHPYAQVKENENDIVLPATYQSGTSKEKQIDTDEFDNDIASLTRPGNESTGNIPAATAIAGHITASDDLPYMTPPAHFSGDSQDSGKGYTSISVREPLSAIRAESKSTSSRKADPHYATVSDDSDDMYAAIDDPGQVYTSESETYAQINTESNRPKSAPQPPSVDSLKQMTISSQSHSRQDSSSSLASSTIVSSPKPEKRPANSPLPPTPTKSPDLFEDIGTALDKAAKQTNSPKSQNLEDMYAKVNKKARRELDHLERGGSIESGVSESSDSLSYKLQGSTTTESSRSCHSFLSKSTLTDTPTSTSIRHDATDSFTSETDPPSGYEKLGGGSFEFDRKSDPGYETVNKGPPSESDPEYEKLKPQISDFTKVDQTKNNDYVNVDRVESDASDGYARVKINSQDNEIYSKIGACESDGYARVKHHEDCTINDGYEKVVNHNHNLGQPNYERMLFSKSDETKHSTGMSEPTYESLGNEFEGDDSNDPNYESVGFVQDSASIKPSEQLRVPCEPKSISTQETHKKN